MNIEKIQEYMSTCPYITNFINVDYLKDSIKSCSVSEVPSYDPKTETDIIGNQTREFQFYFDIKLNWNEEIQNNIDNTKLFKNISEWLEEQDNNGTYPSCDSDCSIQKIEPTSNGYILLNENDEAIYRIAVKITYWRSK